MANGVTIDTNGNPWTIKFVLGGGTPLPATVVGVQNGTNMAYPVIMRRVRWVTASGSAGDQVICQDVPGFGGTGTPRNVIHMVAAAAQNEIDESRPAGKELCVGLVVTQMDSGILYIFI